VDLTLTGTPDVDVRGGGGGGGDGDGDGGSFTRVSQDPDTITTCARDDGRDDTAPYWTALRKYNGAPLLRYVHPNLDVGVGATPLTPLAIYRTHPTLIETGPSVASSSYPFIFRPPLPSAILCNGHPLTPPAPSRQPFSSPFFLTSNLFSSFASSSFSLVTGQRSTLAGPPRVLFYNNTRAQR